MGFWRRRSACTIRLSHLEPVLHRRQPVSTANARLLDRIWAHAGVAIQDFGCAKGNRRSDGGFFVWPELERTPQRNISRISSLAASSWASAFGKPLNGTFVISKLPTSAASVLMRKRRGAFLNSSTTSVIRRASGLDSRSSYRDGRPSSFPYFLGGCAWTGPGASELPTSRSVARTASRRLRPESRSTYSLRIENPEPKSTRRQRSAIKRESCIAKPSVWWSLRPACDATSISSK